MKKKILLWILAVLITLGAAYYQRLTGPTYPKTTEITLNNESYELSLPRSYGGEKYDDCEVKLEISDPGISGKIFYRRYPTEEAWDSANFYHEHRKINSFISNRIFNKYEEDVLVVELPNQPPAGKLEYYIELTTNGKIVSIAEEKPVVIRFKGLVPLYFLIPHVILMFAAMLISNLAGLYAAFNIKRFRFYTFLTLVLLFVGGLILGPVVQKYAFGEFWAGVPFGWDLTDNKLLIAFIVWLIAFIGNRKSERRYLTIIAAVVLLLIYSIPHSMFGSELDYETGEITQGIVLWFSALLT